MGRVFVRNAVAAWFAPPAVANLNTTYTSAERWMPGTDFFQNMPAGTASGAICFPYITDQHRRRITLQGAPPGGKMSYFTVDLVVRFASNQGVVHAAQDDHDALIDAIVVRLEADKRLGTDGQAEQIFMAGEGDTIDAADIHVRSDLPKLHRNQVTIWSVVTFVALEWIAAGTA
jgi:hypothetical protein